MSSRQGPCTWDLSIKLYTCTSIFDASRVTFVKCRDASLYLVVQHSVVYLHQGIWGVAAVFNPQLELPPCADT